MIILLSTVEVAAISGGIPTATYRVIIVISGSPTSNGIPTGIDLTAMTIDVVTRIAPHETLNPNERKTKYGMIMLAIQLRAR